MANSGPNPLQPTWYGHISSTMDALQLFEACLEGRLNHVPRRPHDREREELIRSGNVFIYEEHSSGIKRWTDGYNWSPSRILGNFLIYRELEKAFPPGEKKKAIKKKAKNGGVVKSEPPSRPTPTNMGAAAASAMSAGVHGSEQQSESQRALIGSLVDSYPFKEEGLVKKTISVHWNGIPHHLVSYYKVEDVTSGNLTTPSRDPRLRGIIPRSGLISSQNFRVPVDQDDIGFGDDGSGRYWGHNFGAYTMGDPTYQGMITSSANRSYSMPNMHGGPMAFSNNYAMPAQTGHQIQTLPSNVASNHYQPTYTGFDPIRHAQQSRHHSISTATGLAGGLPGTLTGPLTTDYAKLSLGSARRPSMGNFEGTLVTTAPDMSALPATTLANSEPRTNYFTSSLGAVAESDYHPNYTAEFSQSYSTPYMSSPSTTWPNQEPLHTGK